MRSDQILGTLLNRAKTDFVVEKAFANLYFYF